MFKTILTKELVSKKLAAPNYVLYIAVLLVTGLLLSACSRPTVKALPDNAAIEITNTSILKTTETENNQIVIDMLLANYLLDDSQAPTLPSDAELRLSNTTMLEQSTLDLSIGLLYVINVDQGGQFELNTGLADNDLFEIQNDRLHLKQAATQDNYTVSVRWKADSGAIITQDFTLNTVDENRIVPSQRFGDLAFIGQSGERFRGLTPDRRVVFTGYERYYFSQTGYIIDVCLSTDSVIAVTVDQRHARSGDFVTADSFGFTGTVAELQALYGEPDDTLGFSSYSAYIYGAEAMANINDGNITFGYFSNLPEGATDISISQRYCPTE